jgi:transmembrane sensor
MSSLIEEAAEWFVTLRDDAGDAAQRARFSEWLLRSPEHVRIYLELTSIWAESAGLGASFPDAKTLIALARAESNVVALEERAPAKAPPDTAVPRRSATRYWLAASVAVAAVISVLWAIGRPTVYATGIGEQRSIALVDGSRIELNSRSRLQVRLSAKERTIELLEGQGLFKVAKDPQRPFVVRSGRTRVRAVGTEFDVYVKPGGTVVTVLEGRVEIGTASPVDIVLPLPGSASADQAGSARATSLELVEGEQAVVAPHQIERRARPNIEAATAWTHRQLVFDASPLGEVADEFNRYNFRRLVIADPQVETFPISGVFSSSDPTSLVQFLMEQPEIHVEQTDSEVIITRKMR